MHTEGYQVKLVSSIMKSDSTNVVYMVRDKVTGLFSQGGYSPRFAKRGKIWKKGALTNHLNQQRSIPYNWEVVEVEMVHKNPIGAIEFHQPAIERKIKREEQNKIRRAQDEKKYLEREIERAKQQLKNLQSKAGV